MDTRIDVDAFASEISKMLESYSEEVDEKMKKSVDKAANRVVKMLKVHPRIPVLTGKYKASFRKKEISRGRGFKTVKIYSGNRQHGLTHLLEHGHKMPHNQPDSTAYKHWEDAEKMAQTLFPEFMMEELNK